MLLALAGPTRAEPSVTYQLRWQHSRATLGPSGWEVTNDLGYIVRVEGGYLATHSVELTPCVEVVPVPQSRLDRLAPVAAALLDVIPFVARPAYAGHTFVPNLAAIRTTHVESLAQPGAWEMGTVHPGANEYCHIHYLVARADRTSVNLPTDVDLVDQSLYVRGHYRRPGTNEDVEFSWQTPIANGVLSELYPPGHYRDGASAFHLNTARTGARITIRRDLDRLFDGIDFAGIPPKNASRLFLKNLIDHLVIEVETGNF